MSLFLALDKQKTVERKAMSYTSYCPIGREAVPIDVK